MKRMRKRFDGPFKARVALAAVKGDKTIAAIASQYDVHPNQIRQWKKHLLAELPSLFTGKRKRVEADHEELEAELYRQIGQLKVELDWLKKKSESLG